MEMLGWLRSALWWVEATAVNTVPGLRQGAVKRNVLVLVFYALLLLLLWSLVFA